MVAAPPAVDAAIPSVAFEISVFKSKVDFPLLGSFRLFLQDAFAMHPLPHRVARF